MTLSSRRLSRRIQTDRRGTATIATPRAVGSDTLGRMEAIKCVPTSLVIGDAARLRHAAIASLLAHRAATDRWAIMLAAGPLRAAGPLVGAGDAAGVVIRFAPYGCVGCGPGVPFRVALTRLLREARPDRLLIEIDQIDHLQPAMALLRGEWLGAAIALDAEPIRAR